MVSSSTAIIATYLLPASIACVSAWPGVAELYAITVGSHPSALAAAEKEGPRGSDAVVVVTSIATLIPFGGAWVSGSFSGIVAGICSSATSAALAAAKPWAAVPPPEVVDDPPPEVVDAVPLLLLQAAAATLRVAQHRSKAMRFLFVRRLRL